MSTTTGIILALAIGSVALFSTLFVVVLFSMRNHWDRLADQQPPENQSDA
ncbi:MAG TPA: hypothetical protein VF040_19470 [Ktedonobacterales bacterium]